MAVVGPLRLEISAERRWWFTAALWIGVALIWLGVLRETESVEYWDGKVSPFEQLVAWLVDHAMKIEVRECSSLIA